jgi:hypothetical protein
MASIDEEITLDDARAALTEALEGAAVVDQALHDKIAAALDLLETTRAERDEALDEAKVARNDLDEARALATGHLRTLEADALAAATTDPSDPAWDYYFEIGRRIDLIEDPEPVYHTGPTQTARKQRTRKQRTRKKSRAA